MHVFYHKNKFALSGQTKDVLRFVRSMECDSGMTLREALADRTVSRKIHSFVIRDVKTTESQNHPEHI